MKRLLQITTIASTQRAFLLPFARHFREIGWQVDAVAKGISASPECLQAFDRVWEIGWSRNPLDPRNFFAFPQLIREIVTDGEYDIVHVHTPVAAFVSRYALKNLRKQGKCKVIYTAHGFHFHPSGGRLKNAIFLALEKLAGVWTDALVVINRPDELAAKKHKLLPPERIRYMPGIGVDVDYYNSRLVTEIEVEQLRQELGISNENPLFVCVAEFTPRKRHIDLLQAFAKLGRAHVHLALAGTGPLFREMQQLVSDLGISNQVHFLGGRRDIPALMKVAVANILVSAQEGLPRSVMEALCIETPVIGTKIRGTQELLESGCGLLVEVGDIKELAHVMAWILDHPEDAQAMGKCGRGLMEYSYSLSHIIKLHEQLYTEIFNV